VYTAPLPRLPSVAQLPSWNSDDYERQCSGSSRARDASEEDEDAEATKFDALQEFYGITILF